MANSAGGITFSFSGDLTQLKRDLNRAANLAKQSVAQTNRITGGAGRGIGGGGRGGGGFGGGFEGLFQRRPGIRAEHALGQSLASFAQGDIAGGVASLTGKMTALGLVGGAAAIALVDTFKEFKKEINEANSAHGKLRAELAKPIAGLSETKLNTRREETEKLTEDAVEKQRKFFPLLKDRVQAAGSALIHGKNPFAAGDVAEKEAGQGDQRAGRARVGAIESAITGRQRGDLEIKEEAFSGSEREAALMKIKRNRDEKISELRSNLDPKKTSNMELAKQMGIVSRSADVDMAEVKQKFGHSEAATESSIRMAGFQKEHPFDTGAIKREGIQEKLGLISQEMQGPMSNERRNALSAERLGLESEEEVSAFEESQKTPAQKKREQKQRAKFEQFAKEHKRTGGLTNAHFDMAGRLIGGTDPNTGQHVDVMPNQAIGPALTTGHLTSGHLSTSTMAGARSETSKLLTSEDMERLLYKFFGQE